MGIEGEAVTRSLASRRFGVSEEHGPRNLEKM